MERLEFVHIDRFGITCTLCGRRISPSPDVRDHLELYRAHRDHCNESYEPSKAQEIYERRVY